jgi:hypothetical protein
MCKSVLCRTELELHEHFQACSDVGENPGWQSEDLNSGTMVDRSISPLWALVFPLRSAVIPTWLCMWKPFNYHHCIHVFLPWRPPSKKISMLYLTTWRFKFKWVLSLCLTHRYADMGREVDWVLNGRGFVQLGFGLLNDLQQIIMPTYWVFNTFHTICSVLFMEK